MAKNLIDGNDTKVSGSGNNITIDFSDGTNERLEQIENNIIEVNNKFNYYTEEKVVGTWIDGSTLYKKVLVGKLPTGAGNNDFIIANSIIHSVDGFVKSVYGSWFPISVKFEEDNYNTSILLGSNRDLFTLNCGSFYNTNSDYEITIEYTKTTDSVSTLSLEDDE